MLKYRLEIPFFNHVKLVFATRLHISGTDFNTLQLTKHIFSLGSKILIKFQSRRSRRFQNLAIFKTGILALFNFGGFLF